MCWVQISRGKGSDQGNRSVDGALGRADVRARPRRWIGQPDGGDHRMGRCAAAGYAGLTDTG